MDSFDEEDAEVLTGLAEEAPEELLHILADIVSDGDGSVDTETFERATTLFAAMGVNLLELINEHPDVAEEAFGTRMVFSEGTVARMNREIRRGN